MIITLCIVVFYLSFVISIFLFGECKRFCNNIESHEKNEILDLSDELKINIKEDNLLLVIAHPDDEIMFFGPLIQICTLNGISLKILCLSNGNYDGKGKIRTIEMKNSLEKMEISKDSFVIIDSPYLKDGPSIDWDQKVIWKILEQYTLKWKINKIFTFDEYGISGHKNHKSVHKAVKSYK
ncbi:N-acetylglucosaminyl-phosphatidylinositol de-N-acetylase [Intoshia linei]|uniref:N-acetylglucosaminylphosphatidylinositol deacetylase n=1 Tax=Intoshia linei TaxID=1819745 RepID=A0A177AYS9_9BILA|nr:N-acetylglucosaminyl-phosphatidylinositol de-N-acetylase [Intoshia linei]